MKWNQIQPALRPAFYVGLGTVLVACAMARPEAQLEQANARVVQTDLTKPFFAWFEPAAPASEAAISELSRGEISRDSSVQVANLDDTSIRAEQVQPMVEEAAVETVASVQHEKVSWFRFWQELQAAQAKQTLVQDADEVVALEVKPVSLTTEAVLSPMADVAQVQTDLVQAQNILEISHAALVPSSQAQVSSVPAKAMVPSAPVMLGQAIPASAPTVWSVPALTTTADMAVSDSAAKPIYVAFSNESAKLNPQDAGFGDLLNYVTSDEHYFIVGHSHGNSSVGVAVLAQKRADAVAKALRQKGVDASRIHTMASWSTQGVEYAPLLGVQTFIVKSADPSRVLLAFSR